MIEGLVMKKVSTIGEARIVWPHVSLLVIDNNAACGTFICWFKTPEVGYQFFIQLKRYQVKIVIFTRKF